MTKPKLLDLFAGAGGSGMGYMQAGFEVVGVDTVPQPNYPGTFVLGDALTFPLSGFDALHASPPCPRFSLLPGFHPSAREKHPDYIDAIRQRFLQSGKPYIIENVIGSPVERSILLCGAMFGLRVYRHRLFESNLLLFQPPHPKHTVKAAKPGAIAKPDEFWCIGGHFGQKDEAQRAMGIWWMENQKAIANAIPPAYTKWIGEQLLAIVSSLGAEDDKADHPFASDSYSDARHPGRVYH